MGISTTRKPSSAAAPQAPEYPTEAKQVGASRPMYPQSLADLTRQQIVPNRLTAQAKAYLDDIVDKIKNFGRAGDIRMTSLSTNTYDAVMFASAANRGVLLLFEDNQMIFSEPSTQRACIIDRSADVANQWKLMLGGEQADPAPVIVDYVVVTRDMYDRSWQMAYHIVGCLSDAVMMTVDDILRAPEGSRNAPRLVCSTNLNDVREFISGYSPHAVQARCDSGFVLALQLDAGPFGQQQPPTPILAVSGYTTFISNLAGMSNFTTNNADPDRNKINAPCFVITDAVSILPRAYLMPLLTAATMQTMIFNEGWVAPFVRCGKNDPNIGYLPNTQTPDTPTPCASLDDVKTFVQYYVKTPPFLALDITYGRAKLPGLDAWSDPSGKAQLNDIVSFFGSYIKEDLMPYFTTNSPVDASYAEYIGIAEIGANGVTHTDSRCIDYLFLANNGVPVTSIRKFLQPCDNPWDRINAMSNDALSVNVKPLYWNNRVILNGGYFAQLNALLKAANISIIYDNEQKVGLSNAATQLFQSQANNYAGWTSLNRVTGGFGSPTGKFFSFR